MGREETVHDYMEEELVAVRDILSYVKDLGVVGFMSAVVLLLFGITGELFYPGLVFNHVSPQRLVSAMTIFGLLSLLGPSYTRRSRLRTVAYAVCALSLSILVGVLSWKYFAPVESGQMLTGAAVLSASVVAFGSLYSHLKN